MGCNVMKFDLPTTIEAKFYPKINMRNVSC